MGQKYAPLKQTCFLFFFCIIQEERTLPHKVQDEDHYLSCNFVVEPFWTSTNERNYNLN